jgi:hypothetical protein
MIGLLIAIVSGAFALAWAIICGVASLAYLAVAYGIPRLIDLAVLVLAGPQYLIAGAVLEYFQLAPTTWHFALIMVPATALWIPPVVAIKAINRYSARYHQRRALRMAGHAA